MGVVGAVTPVTQLDAALEEGTHRWPYFLPDGQHFLYTVRAGLAEGRGVYVGSLDGKTKKLLLRGNTNAVYAPSGHLLFQDLSLVPSVTDLLLQGFEVSARSRTGVHCAAGGNRS